uniref:Tudor domain-containing protein 5 n=1 Tax=Cacopsylla melanoneura TaxID=428564 RepID=A0A8D8VMX4_9HEMI
MDRLTKVELPDTSMCAEIQIILQDGLSPYKLSAILYENQVKLNEMMDDLNEVYNAIGRDELQMDLLHVSRGNVCIARYGSDDFPGDWHRCKILRILDSNRAKLLYLDFGTIGYAPCDQLKYMTPDYATLPLQCLYVSLYRVYPVDVDAGTGLPLWNRKGLDKLLTKYENVRVTATVFYYDPKEPRITAWITALDSQGCGVELNKEFCDWGFGILDLDEVPLATQNTEADQGSSTQPAQNLAENGSAGKKSNKKKRNKKPRPPRPLGPLLPRLLAMFKELGYLDPEEQAKYDTNSEDQSDSESTSSPLAERAETVEAQSENSGKTAADVEPAKKQRLTPGLNGFNFDSKSNSCFKLNKELMEDIPIPGGGDDDFDYLLDQILARPGVTSEPHLTSSSDDENNPNNARNFKEPEAPKKKIFSDNEEEENEGWKRKCALQGSVKTTTSSTAPLVHPVPPTPSSSSHPTPPKQYCTVPPRTIPPITPVVPANRLTSTLPPLGAQPMTQSNKLSTNYSEQVQTPSSTWWCQIHGPLLASLPLPSLASFQLNQLLIQNPRNEK